MNIPVLDHTVGMEVYSTDVSGIGGRIKQTRDQFVVEEILDSSFDFTTKSDSTHLYPLYLLKKDGIDSTHAVKEVEAASGVKLKIVALKDARAITTQYASVTRRQQDPKDKIATKHCTLDLVGYTKRPIAKANLVANSFTVIINDFHNIKQSIDEFQNCINKNAIANFYGYQRFGSIRSVTHLVGRELVKRNFKQAVNIFLCYSGAYESEQNKEIREMCSDSSNFASVLRIMPHKMDLERLLISELIRSNDPLRAIRRLPITIRRLFVQSYQSYIFNRSLSTAIREQHDIVSPEENDICFLFQPKTVKMIGMNRFDPDAKIMQLPAIPLAGYAFRDDNRFSRIVTKVLEEEGTSVKDFYIKDLQEVSAEGGFRQASMLCGEFSYVLNGSLQTRFVLPKGTYATILLRELMKPSDPITAGF